MQFIEMVLNFLGNLDYFEILKKVGQALGIKLLGVVFKPVGSKILKRFKKSKISKKKQARTAKKNQKDKGIILKMKIQTRKVKIRIEIKK